MKSFKTFLMENFEYSTLQVRLPSDVSHSIIEYGKKLPDDMIYQSDFNGRETRPHITIKYGIHTDDERVIKGIITPYKKLIAKMGTIDTFEGKDNDVLIVKIDSPDLIKLNKLITDSIPTTSTHPTYIPHATIAYVKKRTADKYKGDDFFSGTTLYFDTVEFSSKSSNEYKEIQLY